MSAPALSYIIDCSNCEYIDEVEGVYEIGDVCPNCGQVTLNVSTIGRGE